MEGRFLKDLKCVATPEEFQEELKNALSDREAVVEQMLSVLRWDLLLRPYLVDPLPVGLCHATLPGEEAVEDEATDESR